MSKAFVTKSAPNFEATAVVDGEFKTVKLSDYKGKFLILKVKIQVERYI